MRQFVANYLLHFVLDIDIVFLYHFIHDVIAILICEVCDDRYWFIGFCFFGKGLV